MWDNVLGKPIIVETLAHLTQDIMGNGETIITGRLCKIM
jgi:hypothetical protein